MATATEQTRKDSMDNFRGGILDNASYYFSDIERLLKETIETENGRRPCKVCSP